MGRTRRRRRAGKSSGGALTSLRGGFRSVARGVVGKGAPAQPASRGRRLMANVLTVVLVLIAVGLFLRRSGLIRR